MSAESSLRPSFFWFGVALCVLFAGCADSDGSRSSSSNTAPVNAQAVLDLEEDAFDEVNVERVTQGLSPVTMDERVRDVARAHSQDMVDRNFFDHVNPDGDDPFDRLIQNGVFFSVAGENLAFNSGFADPVGTAVNGWMNSPGHRANILDPSFVHTGMGVAVRGEGIQAEYYFTQLFVTFAQNLDVENVEVFVPGPLTESAN